MWKPTEGEFGPDPAGGALAANGEFQQTVSKDEETRPATGDGRGVPPGMPAVGEAPAGEPPAVPASASGPPVADTEHTGARFPPPGIACRGRRSARSSGGLSPPLDGFTHFTAPGAVALEASIAAELAVVGPLPSDPLDRPRLPSRQFHDAVQIVAHAFHPATSGARSQSGASLPVYCELLLSISPSVPMMGCQIKHIYLTGRRSPWQTRERSSVSISTTI